MLHFVEAALPIIRATMMIKAPMAHLTVFSLMGRPSIELPSLFPLTGWVFFT